MDIDFIIVHGSPGCGKTTISKKLHRYFESPYFEFGWIPEYRMLAPAIKISQQQEEQLSFENLITVAINYNKHGFKNVILTDLNDARLLDIPTAFSEYNYIILTLYIDSDDVIKQRILTRSNGNTYKDWEQSVNINSFIKRRKELPNEYRVLNSGDDIIIPFKEMITIIESHTPTAPCDITGFTKEDFYSYLPD